MDSDNNNNNIDIKQEIKLLRALSKFLNVSNNPLNILDYKEDLFILDSTNVVLIQALTESSKKILSKFIDSDYDYHKNTPKLEYTLNSSYEIKSFYNSEYLKKVIDILSIFNDSIEIKISFDYPMTISNKHFKIILAPFIKNND